MINKYFNIIRGQKFKKLEQESQEDIIYQILNDNTFIQLVQNKLDWSYEEHDTLVQLLKLPKREGGYFHDKYNIKVSYNGIKTLKKEGTELELSPIHKIEQKKCSENFKYFRKYYCKIQTRDGLQRPEMREYQEQLEDDLLSLEDLAISFSRQSGKTISVGTYLLWRANFFDRAINIGIVANKPRTAREVLGKIKNIFIELPIWLQQTVRTWNKSDIELGTGTRILLALQMSADITF